MKKNRKALLALVGVTLGAAMAFGASGCGGENKTPDTQDTTVASGQTEAKTVLESLGIDPDAVDVSPNVLHDDKNTVGFQLNMPSEGDTIAVIHTGMGDITLRFFPDQAPKSVTNFINLAKSKSYDNTSFHQVFGSSYIQGGHCGNDESSPNGVSSYGGMFEDEFCDSLCNIRGAVSMANSAQDTNGSQFLINQTTAEAFKEKGGWSYYEDSWKNIEDQLMNYKDSNLLSAFIEENGDKFLDTEIVPAKVRALYDYNGGNPTLDGAYNAADRGNTVFAQVIKGMEVVDKICAVKTDKKNVPLDRVPIKSIEITTYKP